MKFIRIFLGKLFRFLFVEDELKSHIKRGLIVGKNFNMLGEVIIDNSHTWHIEIGDNVTLSQRVQILAHDASTKIHLGYTKIGKVKIGNRVFIGNSTIIFPGVVINDDVIVGAGSVVTKDIPARSVVVGNPARIICSIDEFLEKKSREMKIYPCFGEDYTINNNVTDIMKKEMNEKMKERIGYIV